MIIALQIALLIWASLFFIIAVGEKNDRHKMLYLITGTGLFILLWISISFGG